MADEAAAPIAPAREVPEAEATHNRGSNLFRLYVLDADTEPLEPVIKLAWKRGDEYTDVMKRARAYLNRSGPEGDIIYLDESCTTPFDLGEEGQSSWFLAQTRKHKLGGQRPGVDKEWLRITLAREDLTNEQKLAEIAKFT